VRVPEEKYTVSWEWHLWTPLLITADVFIVFSPRYKRKCVENVPQGLAWIFYASALTVAKINGIVFQLGGGGVLYAKHFTDFFLSVQLVFSVKF